VLMGPLRFPATLEPTAQEWIGAPWV
jgi:hypothetical protein